MRKIRVSVLLAVFLVLLPLAVLSCAADKREEKVVFIDLEAVISEERKGYSQECFAGSCRARKRRSGSGVFSYVSGSSCRLREERVSRA